MHNGKKYPYDAITKCCIELAEESRIVGEVNRFYIPSLYYSEVGIGSKIEIFTS